MVTRTVPASDRARSERAVRLPWFDSPVVVGRQRASGHSYSDTMATLGRMALLIRLGAEHPAVRAAALAAVPAGADRREKAAAIHQWVRARVRFVQDETLVAAAAALSGLDLAPDAELLIAPWELLRMSPAQGDCDDFTMLTGAMLRALGVPIELVIVAANPNRRTEYSHVYLYAVLEDGGRLAVDASHGPAVGWEAPRVYRRESWPVLDVPLRFRSTGLNGLNGLGSQPARPVGDALEREVIHGVRASRGAGVGEIPWSSLLELGAKTGAQIATARFAVPPVGTYIQTAQGGTLYRGAENTAGANLPFVPTSTGMGTWILLAGGALLLVLVMGRR